MNTQLVAAHHQAGPGNLRLRRMGINTHLEPVIYMRADSHVCKSEGFEAQSRIEVTCAGRRVIATLNLVTSDLLHRHEAGVSESAWRALGAEEGDELELAHPKALQSFSAVRSKIYGNKLGGEATAAIVQDVIAGNYSAIEMAAFITACAGNRLDPEEVIALTGAMVEAGRRLDWGKHPVVDKHCVGGLPGNRTTLLVVPIVAACGLTIPKTSSRAITSPAGSADTMEALAPVDLNIAAMRRVVDNEGGCIVWGGAVNLSPADDILIRVARPLDLDGEGQMVASILSKKIAAGSSHVLIDIPVGPTAKVRSMAAAESLGSMLMSVGEALGISVRTIMTDGTQPIGRGIGPALEAWDVLAVLQNEADAPDDLRQRALILAAGVLELGQVALPGQGMAMARTALESGAAWRKFQAICEGQGGMREPPRAKYTELILATRSGRVSAIDNRRLARIAKLAGAPKAHAAGLYFHAPVGSRVEVGEALMTVHAESRGELAYALAYAESQRFVVYIEAD